MDFLLYPLSEAQHGTQSMLNYPSYCSAAMKVLYALWGAQVGYLPHSGVDRSQGAHTSLD